MLDNHAAELIFTEIASSVGVEYRRNWMYIHASVAIFFTFFVNVLC